MVEELISKALAFNTVKKSLKTRFGWRGAVVIISCEQISIPKQKEDFLALFDINYLLILGTQD